MMNKDIVESMKRLLKEEQDQLLVEINEKIMRRKSLMVSYSDIEFLK